MSGLSLDLTISAGNIIEIAVIGGGGVAVMAVMRATLDTLKKELLQSKRDTNQAMVEMKRDNKEQFAGIQNEIKRISEVLINQADQNRRIIHLEEDVRDLRHGRGFIERESPS